MSENYIKNLCNNKSVFILTVIWEEYDGCTRLIKACNSACRWAVSEAETQINKHYIIYIADQGWKLPTNHKQDFSEWNYVCIIVVQK